MLGVTVSLRKAEQTKRALLAEGILDKRFRPLRIKGTITFPVTRTSSKIAFAYGRHTFKASAKQQNFKQQALQHLSNEEQALFRRAYDVVGSIAILDIPPGLEQKALLFAELLLKTHKQIKTVLKKQGIHSGTYRTQRLQYLAGEKTKETIHKEHGVRIKLDVEQVYFSPRSSEERKRIASLITKPEDILVMFSGCAPFPLVLAKNSPARQIVGIELNPIGHAYAMENIKLNKTRNILLIRGDVAEIVPGLHRTFDRVLMPLPKGAHQFLDTLLSCTKKGTVVHYYTIRKEDAINQEAESIVQFFNEHNRQVNVDRIVIAGQYAKQTYRYCIDFTFLK